MSETTAPAREIAALDAEQTVEVLRQAVDDRDKGQITSLLRTDQVLNALAELDPAEALALLDLASTIYGCKTAAGTARAQINVRRSLNTVSTEATLGMSFPGLPLSQQSLRVPFGYCIDEDGVWEVDAMTAQKGTRVMNRPWFLTGYVHDRTSSSSFVEMRWQDPSHRWQSGAVSREHLCDTRKIVTLSGMNIPVDSINARDVVVWFRRFEEANGERLPRRSTASRLGWQPDGVFLLPSQIIRATGTTGDPVAFTVPSGFEVLAGSIRAVGDYAEWQQVMHSAHNLPLVNLTVWASLAAPLLSILGVPNFAVELAARTSTGKSSAMLLSGSVWALGQEKQGFLGSWDDKQVWIERASGMLGNLPILLDERKRAPSVQHVVDCVFGHWQGQGRGRGTVTSAQQSVSWSSTMIFSGEHPLSEDATDGGLAGRVLTLKGMPLGLNSTRARQMVQDIRRVGTQHYGHAGPLFVQYLCDIRSEWPELRRMHQEYVSSILATIIDTAIGGRLVEYAAVLALTGHIANYLEITKSSGDPLGVLVESALTVSALDRSVEAGQQVVSWLVGSQHLFYRRRPASGVRPFVWRGIWSSGDQWTYIDVVTTQITAFLKSVGYADASTIYEQWIDKGWVERTTNKSSPWTRSASIDGAKDRVIRLNRLMIDDIVGTVDS